MSLFDDTATTRTDATTEAERPVATWDTSRRGPARLYKARDHIGPRKAPRCIACFPRSRAGQRIPLAYGVTLVLCEDHRDARFIQSRGRRDFLMSIGELFASLGLTARRYEEALRAFVRDLTGSKPSRRRRVGSYAWPERRADAERVWSRGGSFEQGLRVALSDPPEPRARTLLPTTRTVRRWWSERRWLGAATAAS